MRSRPIRRAINDVSTGLCDLMGTTGAFGPVLDELKEPARLIVTTEDDDKELEREEYRWWFFGTAEAGGVLLPPLLGSETAAALPCIIVLHFSAPNR